MIEVIPVPSNALSPISVSVLGRVTLTMLKVELSSDPLKAQLGTLAAPSGTVTFFSVVHPAKGERGSHPGTSSQLTGVVTDTRDVPLKAYSPIDVILSGKVMLEILLEFSNA